MCTIVLQDRDKDVDAGFGIPIEEKGRCQSLLQDERKLLLLDILDAMN